MVASTLKSQKKVVLYTASYPYEGGESFIANELTHLVNHFDKVIIVPYQRKGAIRSLPDGVEVVDWKKWSNKGMVKASLGRIMMSEFRHGENRSAFVRKFRAMRFILKQRGVEAVALQQFIEEYDLEQALHYTYWFDHWTLSLALLKEEGLINYLISRAHGFDLYHDRTKSGLIPFRHFTMGMLNEIFLISTHGLNYLSRKYPMYTKRMHTSYLGTSDYGLAQNRLPDVYTIVSCSSAKPIKRLHLIFKAFLKLTIPAKWIHIGDGQTLSAIEKELTTLPIHLKVELLGNMSNQAVMNLYKHDAVSLFVNVSETEGLPVSIMEAISFGIPVLATDVGGTSEIVFPASGELLPANIGVDQLAEKLADWSEKSQTIDRWGVRSVWENNFNAERNYLKFCEELKSIH